MKSTLKISDLPVCAQLSDQALCAVRGGQDNQANGTSQSNAQVMMAAANVGNGSIFQGPATIQSDNTFTQTASNWNYAENDKGLSVAYPVYGLPVVM